MTITNLIEALEQGLKGLPEGEVRDARKKALHLVRQIQAVSVKLASKRQIYLAGMAKVNAKSDECIHQGTYIEGVISKREEKDAAEPKIPEEVLRLIPKYRDLVVKLFDPTEDRKQNTKIYELQMDLVKSQQAILRVDKNTCDALLDFFEYAVDFVIGSRVDSMNFDRRVKQAEATLGLVASFVPFLHQTVALVEFAKKILNDPVKDAAKVSGKEREKLSVFNAAAASWIVVVDQIIIPYVESSTEQLDVHRLQFERILLALQTLERSIGGVN